MFTSKSSEHRNVRSKGSADVKVAVKATRFPQAWKNRLLRVAIVPEWLEKMSPPRVSGVQTEKMAPSAFLALLGI